MVIKISLFLTILVPVLAILNKNNNFNGTSTKQPAFRRNGQVKEVITATSEGLVHRTGQVPQHSDAKGMYGEKAAQKLPMGFSDISTFGENLVNDGPMAKFNGTIFLMENIASPVKFMSSIMDDGKNARRVRDTSAADTFGEENASNVNVSHLASMCPFADICDIQGREVQEKYMDSCCLPCSCESTCSEIGNCCEKRENIGNMCHYPLVHIKNVVGIDVEYQYIIVDKCLDGSHKDCKEMEAAPWGSLYPVYEPVSQVSFYNPQCAKCNGVEEFTKWELTIDYQRLDVKNEHIRRALKGEHLDECRIKFIPPKNMNILNNMCSDRPLIDVCNITGSWKSYDAAMEEACLRWHAPVLQKSGSFGFENIYCKLCNNGDHEPEELCLARLPDRVSRTRTHIFMIDYRQVSAIVDENDDKVKSTETGVCGNGMVKHISQPECRRVLCPNGFVGPEGRCRSILTKLLNDLYYVQLHLTPISDTYLTRLVLGDLTDEQRETPEMWFDAQGAPLDFFEMYSKWIDINNVEYVKSLVVRVGRKRYPLNLDKEIQSIQKALEKPWVITLKGLVFQFSVKFDRYAWYVPTQNAKIKSNVLNHITLSGDALALERATPEEFYKDEFLYTGPGDPFTLKKTHFCNRVRLTRSEWVAEFQEIRLNTSQEIFDSNKRLGDSEFDIFLDETGRPTVEICIEDFNPNHQEQHVMTHKNTASMLYMCEILIIAAILIEHIV